MLPAARGSARCCSISAILENAARVAPDAVAATLDDDAITFAEIEARGTDSRTGCSARGSARGDRVLWWGDTSLEAMPVVRGDGKDRRGVRAAERPGIGRGGDARRRVRTAPLTAGRSCIHGAGRRAGAHSRRSGARRPRRSFPCERASEVRSRRERSARHLLHQREHGPAQGRRPLAPRQLVAHVRRRRPLHRAAAVSFACSRCSTWRAGRSRSARGRRGARCTSSRVPDAATLLATTERHRAARLYCIPAVWGRILQHGVDGYDLSSLVEADTGTSATPPELLAAIKAALPHTVTRVFYGSTEAGPTLSLPDADLERKPGSCGIAQPAVEVRVDERGEVCARSPFLMDGYFDDPDATAEALRRRLVPHGRSRSARTTTATSRSSAAPAT